MSGACVSECQFLDALEKAVSSREMTIFSSCRFFLFTDTDLVVHKRLPNILK